MAGNCTIQEVETSPILGDLSACYILQYGSTQGGGSQTFSSSDLNRVTEELLQQQKEVTVMVAGKPRSGKSTALNNIFGLNLIARPAACSVTTKVTKQSQKKNEVSIHIIDTPGLGALDVKRKDVLNEMSKLDIKGGFTLLYCLPVGPSNSLTEMDRAIIRNLNDIFGSELWNRCFILLTSSDTIRRDEYNSQDSVGGYKEYLRGHVQEFQKELKACYKKVPDVKTIFENPSERDIVAIPVGKYTDRDGDPNIMPGIICEDNSACWSDYAILHIAKSAGDLGTAFIRLRYNIAIVVGSTTGGGFAGAAVGTGIGAGIGFGAGSIGGPVGMATAAAIGAGIGAGVSLVGSAFVSSLLAVIQCFQNKTKKKTVKL